MMRIGVQTGGPEEIYGVDATYKLIKEAGFDAVSPVWTWDDQLLKTVTAARDRCLYVQSVHAPFPSTQPDLPRFAEYNSIIVEKLQHALRFAARLGCKCAVVHPLKEFPYNGREQYWKDANMDFYRSLAPAAKEAGIKIALENMFDTDPLRKCYTPAACGDPRVFADYLDTLADDCFTACLDLGHCALCGYSAADCIRILGGDRLTALHVHDNDCRDDHHLPPFTGKQDWYAVTDALREIGYKGEITLEADRIFINTPEEMFPSTLRYLHDTARWVADRCEK